jgi:hypothetical protein
VRRRVSCVMVPPDTLKNRALFINAILNHID